MKGQHESYSETIGDNYQVRCGGTGKRKYELKCRFLFVIGILKFYVRCKSLPSHSYNARVT